MFRNVRKAQPDCVHYFLTVLRCADATGYDGRQESCDVEQLVSILIVLGKYSPSTAKQTVYNAISDRLLMPVNGPSSTSTAKIKRVRLPNRKEALEEYRKSGSHDWYCYECHLPGILEHCTQCWRSFHRLCFRKDPRKPNYLIPSDKAQRTRLPTFTFDVEIKSEVFQTNEEVEDIDLCTSCRLMKKARDNTPPNRQPDELNFLIGLTYDYNRTWLSKEVQSHMISNCYSLNEFLVLNIMFLYSPIRRMADIDKKIKNQKYRWLMEFLSDLLDMQHNIAVFFGNYSAEADSTKWLIRYVNHDLNEICICPDCFRYSFEKDSCVWFAKPCVRRHELVYAKYNKCPYWPAKIVQYVSENKFDVRFFGGDHSRALVNVRNIKPIDTDVKSLKLGRSSSITKAMDELQVHQMLNTYPPSAFSFHSNPEDVENILRTVLGPNFKLENFGRSRRRKRKKSVEVVEDTPNPRHKVHEMMNEMKEYRKIIDENIQKIEKLQDENKKLLESINSLEMDEKNSKRTKWCYMCLRQAILVCCCSAAYCSEICQTRHWNAGHNKNCKKTPMKIDIQGYINSQKAEN